MTYEFLVISMKTRNNKQIYLKEGKSDKSFEWTFDKDKAIWFETDKELCDFANSYFKNFKNWGIANAYVNTDNL